MTGTRLLLLLVLVGCHFGPRAQSYPPAVRPDGALVQVKTRDTAFSAELLAVDDTGLLLLRKRTLVFASYPSMRRVSFPDLSEELDRGERPDTAVHQHLRLVSRFPQGVSPDRLRSLLGAYGQDSVLILKP